MNAGQDWKPVEVFQQRGRAGPRSGACDDTSKCVLNSLNSRKILDRDAEHTCICIVQPGRDKRASDEIGCVFTQNWPDVAEGTNVVETGFRESCDVWVKRKRLIESDA